MTYTVCTKFDKTGTFITRCTNYKRDSVNQHEKSESHKVNVIKFNGQKNPQNSEGAKALTAINQLTVNRTPISYWSTLWTDISQASCSKILLAERASKIFFLSLPLVSGRLLLTYYSTYKRRS